MRSDHAVSLHRQPELCPSGLSQPVDPILGHSLLRTLQVRLHHGNKAQTFKQGRTKEAHRAVNTMSGVLTRSCNHNSGVSDPSAPPPVGEAAHVEEREEEDLLLRVVSPDSSSVHVVVGLHPGEENHRRDPTREERSVLVCLSCTRPRDMQRK